MGFWGFGVRYRHHVLMSRIVMSHRPRNPPLPGCCGGFHRFSECGWYWRPAIFGITAAYQNWTNWTQSEQVMFAFLVHLHVFFPTCPVRASRFEQTCNSFLLPSSSASSGCCGGRLDPNTCQRECQKECQNRCQIECQKESQKECQVERLDARYNARMNAWKDARYNARIYARKIQKVC